MSLLKHTGCIILVLLSNILIAQTPTSDFAPPVDPPLRLSGTFGELRTNHFHTGIDIKSKGGTVGDPVYAVQDGWVSRIKIQAAGYGNAVYIDHPGGLTSVYGHLDEMLPEWAEWVRAKQFERQSFEVDLRPDSAQFIVEKGQRIGDMGTTGYSFGPHLHFELRHTISEAAVNPLLYAFAVRDNIPPTIRNLHIYSLDPEYEVKGNHSFKPLGPQEYRIRGDTLSIGAWRVGIGLDVTDRMNGVLNRNGIYSIRVLKDGEEFYTFQMDSLRFRELLYINAHRDYRRFVRNRRKIHRCYRLPGNRLDIYGQSESNGLIDLYKDQAQQIDIEVTDHSGNVSTLRFWIRRDEEMPGYETVQYVYRLRYGQPNVIRADGMELIAPLGSFYKDLYLDYEFLKDGSSDVHSGVYILQNEDDAIHRPMVLRIRTNPIDSGLRDRAYIARCGSEKDVNMGGSWEGEYLRTEVREFGTYCIKVDTVAPSIRPVRLRRQAGRGEVFRFRVEDDLPTSGLARGLEYEGMIDGRWVPVEYDYKNDLMAYRFLEDWEAGEHEFVLRVTDDRGNRAEYRQNFVWEE